MIRNNLTALLIFFTCAVNAQFRDAGMWTEFSLSARVTKKLDVSLVPEIRMNENITNVSRLFTDAGIQYSFSKEFSGSMVFRTGIADAGTYYEPRQRIQFGLSYKRKAGDFTFGYQPRWQLAISSIAAESDADLSTTMRNRFQVKYTGLKKTDLDMSFELFNATTRYQEFTLQNWRWIARVSRELSGSRAVSAGYLIQKSLTSSPMSLDYVFLLSFEKKFDFRKKKKDEKNLKNENPGEVLPAEN